MKRVRTGESITTKNANPTRRGALWRLLGLFSAKTFEQMLRGQPVAIRFQSRQFLVPIVSASGELDSHYKGSARYFSEAIGGAESMLEMALIPGATYVMGTGERGGQGNLSEAPPHNVSIRAYALGVFPVTKGQWRLVSDLPRVSIDLHRTPRISADPATDDRLPVDEVSWPEAEECIGRLRLKTGRGFRLPTEAEWEYACRAGTTSKYHFGDGISLRFANYNDGMTRPLSLSPVGGKESPNRFGLHDMHGNVLEWCEDWAHDGYVGAPVDGSAWIRGGLGGAFRIARGGMYLWNADVARSTARWSGSVQVSFSGLGFRLAMDLPDPYWDPMIAPESVVNAASGMPGPVSPGQLISIRRLDREISEPKTARIDERGFVASELDGIRVLFDGVAAPLLYASADQVNAIVPFDVSGRSATQVILDSHGQTSPPISIAVTVANPALFTADQSGTGLCACLNADGSQNAVGNPARQGEEITVFATGLGQTSPPGTNGKLAVEPAPIPVLGIELFIDDKTAEITVASEIPGQPSGVVRVSGRIPEFVGAGLRRIRIRVGESSSQVNVFVATQ